MKKTTRFWVNILIILVLLIGSIGMLRLNGKIIITSAKLIVLRDNASFYNESLQKTDEMTKAYNENHMERQELYTSDDTVVRIFSNLPTLVKLVILFSSISLWVLIPYMWYLAIKTRINKVRKARIRRAKRQAYMARNIGV